MAAAYGGDLRSKMIGMTSLKCGDQRRVRAGSSSRHDDAMASSESDPSVDRLEMTYDELVVLFELLHRWEDEDRVREPRDDAERAACGISRLHSSRSLTRCSARTTAIPWTRQINASLPQDDPHRDDLT
jgi:hypothetical protein